MSHNANKVNTQEPNRAGEVSQALGDLSDVTITSVSDGQFVQYDNSSSAWKNVAQPTATSFNYLQAGAGSSNDYNNAGAGASISASDKLRFYAPTSDLVNSITGATVNSSSDWIDYITLPAGNYLVFVTYGVEFTGTGYLTYSLATDTGSGYNVVAYNASIGSDTTTYASSAGQIVTYLSLSGSSTDVAVLVDAVSNVAAVNAQGNTPSERGSIMILKV